MGGTTEKERASGLIEAKWRRKVEAKSKLRGSRELGQRREAGKGGGGADGGLLACASLPLQLEVVLREDALILEEKGEVVG